MSTDRKIFVGFAGSIGLTLATIAVSFFQLRLLLHFFPQATVGIWLLFTSMGAYVLFFDLGLAPTLGREVSFLSARQDLNAAERAIRTGTLIRSCTRTVSLLSLVVYLIAAFGGWAYIRTVLPPGAQHELHVTWLIYAAGSCLNLVGEGWFASIYGMGEVFTEKLIHSSGVIFGFSLMALSVWLGFGLRALAVCWLAQTIMTLTAARIVHGRLSPGTAKLGSFDFDLIRRLAAPSLKYSLTLLGGILVLQTDNLVIASTLGTKIIPDYQAIAKIVVVLMSLSMTLVVTATPFMSQAHAQEDPVEIRRLLERNQRFSLSVLIIAGSCLGCFADRIISLWLGQGHFIGFGVVWVLLAIMFLEAHHLAMATATMATGRIVFVWPALIAGGLNIAFSIFLSHRIGALGVALGTLFAQMLTNNWYVPHYVMKQFNISFLHHLRRVILPMLALLSLTALTGLAVRGFTSTLPALPAIMIGCVAAGGSGLALFFGWILSAQERHIILGKLRQRLLGQRTAA